MGCSACRNVSIPPCESGPIALLPLPPYTLHAVPGLGCGANERLACGSESGLTVDRAPCAIHRAFTFLPVHPAPCTVHPFDKHKWLSWSDPGPGTGSRAGFHAAIRHRAGWRWRVCAEEVQEVMCECMQVLKRAAGRRPFLFHLVNCSKLVSSNDNACWAP